jgi:hypothetical protein
VLARFRFPEKFLAINEYREPYYNFVNLDLDVTPTKISEFRSFESGILSAGGRVKLRGLKPWDSLFDKMNKSLDFSSKVTNYRVVDSEIEGTKKYDDLNCKELGLDSLDELDIERLDLRPHWKKLCFSYRNQYYWWKSYPEAYARCPRVQFRNGKEISIACQVTSLITSDIIVLYSVPDELIRNSSWINLDKRIQEFVLGHLVEEG